MDLQKAIEEAKKSEKRNFIQSVDLIVSLKDFNIESAEKIEEFVSLPNKRTKTSKVCAIVGPELKDQAEKSSDKVILARNLAKWSDKRDTKKLARKFDFFIAQATVMPQVAQTFGRYFGPLGKMPNPKAGGVVAPTANITPLIERLKNSVKINISKTPVSQCSIGDEKMGVKEIAENASAVLKALEHKLPRGKQNIGKIFVKTTMGKAIRV